jgi:lysozyme family protein
MIFVGWLAQKNIIPTADLENIQLTTTAFVTMLGTLAYGAFDLWLTSRQKAGVKAMQAAINKSDNSPVTVKVDGVAGNESVKAAAVVADVPVSSAIAAAKSA